MGEGNYYLRGVEGGRSPLLGKVSLGGVFLCIVQWEALEGGGSLGKESPSRALRERAGRLKAEEKGFTDESIRRLRWGASFIGLNLNFPRSESSEGEDFGASCGKRVGALEKNRELLLASA